MFLVDQPRRGAADATEEIVNDPGDVANGRFRLYLLRAKELQHTKKKLSNNSASANTLIISNL